MSFKQWKSFRNTELPEITLASEEDQASWWGGGRPAFGMNPKTNKFYPERNKFLGLCQEWNFIKTQKDIHHQLYICIPSQYYLVWSYGPWSIYKFIWRPSISGINNMSLIHRSYILQEHADVMMLNHMEIYLKVLLSWRIGYYH